MNSTTGPTHRRAGGSDFPTGAVTGDRIVGARRGTGAIHRVQPYNFRRPSRFGKDHLRSLQLIYEQFARSLASSLSTYLRLNVRIQLDDVEQAGFEEFVDRLPSPTILYVLRLPPLEGPVLLELSLPPARVMLDRLCGGPGLIGTREGALTEIERSLLRPLGRHILRATEDAWSASVPLTSTAIEDVLVNPRAARAVAPNDAIAMVTFELAVGDLAGQMSLCLPHLALEPVADQLSSRAWTNAARGAEDDENEERLRARLLDVPLSLVVQLGEVEVPASLLLSLQEGDVLRLATPVRADLTARLGDQPMLRVQPGLSEGRIAVRVKALGELTPRGD